MRLLIAASLFALAAIQPGAAADLSAYKRPLTVPFEGVTAYSPQLATLGKMLFFDPRLSGNKNMTCASCHNPSFGFETPVKTPIGAANTALGRQAPTVLNVAWVSPFFWDGRAPNLEQQAAGPITAAAEMNGKLDDAVSEMHDIPDYKKWFGEVFPDKGISKETLLTAIATYERTVVSNWSPFDRWVDGDEKAVSDSAKRGFELFTGTAGCSACHSGWNFTDNKFHDIGLPSDDIGRYKIDPSSPGNKYAFKTPGLRNTLYRGPYMHDGSLKSMDEVITHYESGGVSRPSLDPAMSPFLLTEEESKDLVAFLGTLTAEKQDIPLPTLPN
ncbi:cytochrome c peroxidase [Rhizobium redzepovicii]|uniref:Cytochrome c peroxidase n=1 Tax=Rhizobium redzepovicii TaxID=2867518 RepID=A0AAW8NYG9_9HYPH|nr:MULTISPECIES: cytochrome c peroxidase [Rhizobium]MBY4592711.1 c-type cytochrome [Rhizobium redzepovicii]MBY4612720.1 c-type cytochrome [Rhizobium redzepovicii]MDF0661850.1 cytochrome c peroxidase [Rhizobium sp. BC49]MDR9759742.1 cytochrome c peroxidase [Rhizobium redzepovicii]MDR9780714.1 cytochrome c peroxidase [Rhizobium redzepovicii]